MKDHREGRSSLHTLLAAILVAVVVLGVFLPARQSGFVAFDDDSNVFHNVYLTPVTSQTLPRFWTGSYYHLYTPVSYSLWTLAAVLPGAWLAQPAPVPGGGLTPLDATPFHALGIAFHVANALLLFGLLSRLPFLRDRSPFLAGVGAVFWATHPLMVEPVAWVTGNNNVFAGFFMLLALALFVRRFDARSQRTALLWVGAATVAFALALLAKPTAAALPFMAFALAVGAFRAPARSLLAPLGSWLLLAAALLFVAQRTADPANDVSMPFWQRPLIAGDALAFYLGKVLVPQRLGIDYGRSPEWLRQQGWFHLTWLVPAVLGMAAYGWYRRTRDEAARLVLTGLALFAFGAAPMLGFATYYAHRFSTVADRYVYSALIGIALILVVLLARLFARLPILAVGIASIVLLGSATLCRTQIAVWHDSRSLFEHAIEVHPGSMMAHNNLALVLADLKDLEGALREARIAESCPPEGGLLPSMVAITKANVLFDLGRLPEAEEAYRASIASEPNRILPYENLAVVLHQMSRESEAKAILEAATTVEGPRAESVFGIGMTLLKNGVPELGLPYIVEAARGDGPHAVNANFVLGVQLANQGESAKAEPYFRAALSLRPDWGEAADLLGQVLARQGKTAEAQRFFAQAERLGRRAVK